MLLRALVSPAAIRPPLVGNRVVELRRAGVSAANQAMRRRSGFHGWLQTTLLQKHALTSCGCGLINCQ
jgi:hypothetical protein